MSKQLNDENPVRISELKDAIRMSIATKRALMIWGAPGIGKSEGVEQIALEQDRPIIDLRLLLMEPTDLRGMPFKTEYVHVNDDGSETVRETVLWAAPEELPREGYKENAILFLDEISAAPPMVQAAAYQLVLNRRIGTYVLPDGVDIVAAGNRMTDKAVSFRMPSALANRFVHCTLNVDFEEWKSWAISSGKVDSSVIAYHIETSGSKLFTFDPKNHETAFATPRSWVFASDMVAEAKKLGGNNESLLQIMVGGCIGTGLASEFVTFSRMEKQLPKTEDILSGKVRTAKDLKDKSAKYLVIINLCHYMKNHFGNLGINHVDDIKDEDMPEILNMCDNFMNFVMNEFEDELSILALKTALMHYGLKFPYSKMKTFDQFTDQYAEFILD